MWKRWTPLALTILLAGVALAQASDEVEVMRGPDRVDVESTRALREATTDPSFLSEWVDYVPESDSVPSPRDFHGYAVGTQGKLTRPADVVAYFKKLAETSARVEVFSLGQSNGGREMIVAAIASEAILARLDEIKTSNRQLADPRGTTPEQAREIAAAIPSSYYITAGLHSPETGPPEMVMELAYRLAVSEQNLVREIRDNVLVLITPVLEMDGRARQVDWYYRHLTKVTDLQDSPPRSPPYWGDYVFHDNNRDGLQMSQPLTRNFTEAFHEFLPAVSLDLHESVPLLYVSLGTGPYNETIDPITVTEWQWLASYDVSRATRMGLPGVWTWGFYTGWYPGYLLWVTNNHNAVGRFYETYGNSLAGTFTRDLKNARYSSAPVRTRQWYRAWPPERKVLWSLRNNTNYMQTGVLASLELAAKNSETLLTNFYQKGVNSLEKGRSEPPYAFHVPAEQRDRSNLHHLLRLLAGHRIEVHRASSEITLGEHTIAAGDFVVRLDQPYRNFAKTLLSKQDFPKSADHTPYDDLSWSYEYMLGIEVTPIDDKSVQDAEMEILDSVPDLPGTVEAGTRWIVEHRGQGALASWRWALEDAEVRALSEDWEGHSAGSLVVSGVDETRLEELGRTLHLDASSLAEGAEPPTIDVNLPRLALYHTWASTQSSGWTRYTLEQLGIPFTLIDKDDVRAGGLGERFDVVVVPSQGRLGFKGIVHGIDTKWSPLAYTTTPEFPSHGHIDSSDDITGGMGFVGLEQLRLFVEDGGLLVTLGAAGVLASDSGLARQVASEGASSTPGSHITSKVLRSEHPTTWGYPPTTHVFHGNLPRFTVRERDLGMTVMQYGTQTLAAAEKQADRETGIDVSESEAPGKKVPLCLSGQLENPKALQRKPAILDVPVGQGRVVLFSWNPFHRYQNHHDFAFVTNALLFWDDFPDTVSEDEMRRREE